VDDLLPPTQRTTVRRLRQRGVYERAAIHQILDEAIVCQVGFVVDGAPYVIPTIHARLGDQLYLHGAPANHMLGTARSGVEICVSVTLLDGLVLARSAFHHSVNYRSVTVFGRACEVTDNEEKMAALTALVDHVVPGRSADARPPNASELRTTLVLRLPVEEASAKVRTGPPVDDTVDLTLAVWAGVIPFRTVQDPPIAAPDLEVPIEVPAYAAAYRR
jgi:uncharacterized protein